MNAFLYYGLPIGALVIGAAAFFRAIKDSRRFDRMYGSKQREPKAAADLFNTPPRRV